MANNEPYTNESNATGASTNANAIETLLKKLDSNNDGILDEGLSSQVSYSNLTNVPSSFTPSSHSHTIAEVTDLQTSLNAKSDTTHTHSLTDLSNVSVSGTDAPNDGQVLKFDSSGNVWKPANDLTGTGAGSTFVGLSDTPSSLVNDKWLKVSSGSIVLTDAPSTGGGEANQNAFSTIAVSGQTNIAADSATDTLNIAGAGATSVTTNDSTDTITITTELNDTDHGGNAITIASGVINHTDTSTLLEDGNNNASNSNGTVLQSITFDTFGHATAVGNVDLDTRYSQTSHNHNAHYLQVSNNLSDVTASTARTNLGLGEAAVKDFDTAGGVQAYDADTVKSDTATNFTAPVRGGVDSDQSSAGVCDLSEANNHAVAVSGATTISVTNPTAGQSGVITITHDGSAVNFSGIKFEGGSAPNPSTSGVDLLAYYVESASRVSAVLLKATA